MSRDDIQKLLGGYATGTLTPEEQQALFEAALADQELFDSLAREEALREVLSDPSARAHVLAAMDGAPAPWYRQWWRPMVVMAAAVLVVTGVAVWQRSRAPKPLPMAKVELPRWRPPTEIQNAPILPPPPQVKSRAPGLDPLSLPAATPAAAPPPPPVPAAAPATPLPAPQPSAAPAHVDAVTVNGAVSGGFQQPMQQSQQTQQLQAQGRLQALPADGRLAPSAGNNFLQQPAAALHGVVTDAKGAGVRSASVVVKSLSTGEVVNTSTDDHGEFSAPAAPGSTYQISASAPGFRNVTVSRATPVTGTAEPVNLRLDAGSTAEAIEVTAAASTIEARAVAIRAGSGGAVPAMKKAKAPASSEIEYHILRRIPGGNPVEVAAGETVPPGASLILRVTPAADGYLRIVESAHAIASPKVKRGVAFETELPQFDKPGRVVMQVYFSRQAAEAKEQAPSATVTIDIQ